MDKYPFTRIEKKWQDFWEENKTFKVEEDPAVPADRRRYILDMFPYPSAAGLHVGHPEGYTATDIYCRYLRMNGYAVLHPMGFDSFGLPAENYAIQTGTHPLATTEANIQRFRKQIKALGFSYDWDREISTHEPDYYRWTQWIFLKLYERGLAYMDEVPVWYCEDLGTVLANEEVLATPDGPRSERGNHPVERRPLRQWILKITEYADRLLDGLDDLDWPESIKTMQRNWIGRSEGADVDFGIEGRDDVIQVYTTRPDTLFGATYMVLAPEHPLVETITTSECKEEVDGYVFQAKSKSDLERTDLAKDKTGVFSGTHAINPVNNAKIPIWIADYVLATYGYGAIMAVPAHDQRDWEFATEFGLEIIPVLEGGDISQAAHEGEGRHINSGFLDGMSKAESIQKMTEWLEKEEIGKKAINYKLRDWIFSRQRYWGEPIPVVHCEGSGVKTVSEDSLPLLLPDVESYKPTGTGESPLAAVDDWIATTCPDDGSTPAKRESNTMPQWAGSCWYFLRYLDPENENELASREKVDYWMPVDLYVGGAEHAVLHLLYARFWHKVLYDIGAVNTDEPFQRLVNQGMILGEGGVKMSKSLGNVINPDDIIEEFGADSMRMYEMFMGPLEMSKPWSTKGLKGVHRFLDRVWRVSERDLAEDTPPKELIKLLHQTIKKVDHDTANLEFNTAIAQMMIFINEVFKVELLYRQLWEPFVLILSPYAPHLAEELWEKLGNTPSTSTAQWPSYEEELTKEDVVTVVVQVNGKVRAKLEAAAGTAPKVLEEEALKHERIIQHTEGKTVVKVITIPDKLVNVVVK